MNEVVSIIFRLLNFAVALIAAWYVFKRYGVPFITADLKKRAKELDDLQEKSSELLNQEKNAQQAILDQQQLFVRLNKKIEQWNAVFKAEIVYRDREKQKLRQELTHKAAQQQDHLKIQHAQERILPAALNQAQRVLIEEFKHPDRSNSYIDTLIAHMRQGS